MRRVGVGRAAVGLFVGFSEDLAEDTKRKAEGGGAFGRNLGYTSGRGDAWDIKRRSRE